MFLKFSRYSLIGEKATSQFQNSRLSGAAPVASNVNKPVLLTLQKLNSNKINDK